jgi:hypothetical protein
MEKSEAKGPLGRWGVDQRIILKWILNRTGDCGLDSMVC